MDEDDDDDMVGGYAVRAALKLMYSYANISLTVFSLLAI